jgi:polysaccharide export outer membrane protein
MVEKRPIMRGRMVPVARMTRILMRLILIALLAIAAAGPAFAQQQEVSKDTRDGESNPLTDNSTLPLEAIGKGDLVGITVYDSPELTRSVHVDSDGFIRLPMIRRRILAAGLGPAELESAISTVLTDENVLVDPIVTVSIVEYRSRPITVVGAVKAPLTFQASGPVTLLEALSRAGGIAEGAGPEILVSHSPTVVSDSSITLTERISVRALYAAEDSASNITLRGGEDVRVPEAGRVFVVGDVKKPGMVVITDGSTSSVLKAVALSQGLDAYSAHVAYIYRTDARNARKIEIPVQVKKIMDRKSPDVPLYPNDMLYVPSSTGQRVGAKALELTIGAGIGLAGLLVAIAR